MVFYSRRERNGGRDRHLSWKVRSFFAGAVLGLFGMALENPWLLGSALAVLAAGFVLRFFDSESGEEPGEGWGRQDG